MSAISGTRRAMKEMADGTIRVQVDIDPNCRGAFLALFPNIDMPVALAPLVADFEQREPEPEKPKGGALAKLAGMWCGEEDFRSFLAHTFDAVVASPEDAAEVIREVCEISTRAELDWHTDAAARFQELIRLPFMRWKQGVAA